MIPADVPRDADGRATVTIEHHGTEYVCDLVRVSAPDGSGWALDSVQPEVDRATADDIAWKAVAELDRKQCESWFEARLEAVSRW